MKNDFAQVEPTGEIMIVRRRTWLYRLPGQAYAQVVTFNAPVTASQARDTLRRTVVGEPHEHLLLHGRSNVFLCALLTSPLFRLDAVPPGLVALRMLLDQALHSLSCRAMPLGPPSCVPTRSSPPSASSGCGAAAGCGHSARRRTGGRPGVRGGSPPGLLDDIKVPAHPGRGASSGFRHQRDLRNSTRSDFSSALRRRPKCVS